MRPITPDVFRAYDIRGVVDQDFDPEWVETLGRACGTYFIENGHLQAVVGRDCRHSSLSYQQSLVLGLMETGVDVTVLPMVPTPVLYYAVRTLNRQAGVMITASHNPPEYNGFKIWSGMNTIHSQEIQRIYEIMHSGQFAQGRGVVSELDIIPQYIDELSSQTRLSRQVRVVVDGGNGSAGEICAQLLTQVGAEVISLYCQPDPDFPNHHPDPTVAENIRDLQATVRTEKADLGIGLDGDGDRIGVVDENGEIMYGDRLLALFARHLLPGKPGAKVLAEVKCSHLLFQDIASHGGTPEMCKTGHSLIKARMQETGALLAGEMSGHMFFADRYYGFDDALYAAQRLVEILEAEDKPLSKLLDDWPHTASTPEIRLDCPDALKFEVVERAKAHFIPSGDEYQVIDVDGVRLDFGDSWGLVRASNTQPVLVLRFEAENEKRLQEIREFVETPLQGWIAELAQA
ncbi:MAG: phosphomannomutase/phosphoglucomutase [Desulfovermiculus sp.]|nr:phosphomannomutase/phosphoglucomutase [Desulfovermiculus sp.]